MDWMRQIDCYCERLDAHYWAEPINAVTNAAFLIAALVMWHRTRAPICRCLCVMLALIGAGSYLFHTHAQIWAALTDVLPIAVFVFVYIWGAYRYFWSLQPLGAALATLGFVPFAALTGFIFSRLPFFEISSAYWPVALMIALHGLALRRRLPAVSQGLLIGAGLLTVSLIARSSDMPLCSALPIGTHFLWHLLNGVMLGWMIEVLHRHLAKPAPRG